MNRDIYLILFGAGVALGSNLVMRFLEFLLRFVAKRLYFSYKNNRNRKILRQELMGIKVEPRKHDFWSDLLIDLARLRGGGGKKPGPETLVDYILFTFQWIVTIGALVLWYIKVMPQIK